MYMFCYDLPHVGRTVTHKGLDVAAIRNLSRSTKELTITHRASLRPASLNFFVEAALAAILITMCVHHWWSILVERIKKINAYNRQIFYRVMVSLWQCLWSQSFQLHLEINLSLQNCALMLCWSIWLTHGWFRNTQLMVALRVDWHRSVCQLSLKEPQCGQQLLAPWLLLKGCSLERSSESTTFQNPTWLIKSGWSIILWWQTVLFTSSSIVPMLLLHALVLITKN